MTNGQLSPVPTHQKIKMRPAALKVRQGVAILNRRKTKKYSLFSVHTTTSSAATSSSAASTDTAVDKGAGCPENTAPPRECRSASVMSGALSGNTTSRRAADGVALILSSLKPLPSPILICAEPYALANRATHLHRQAHGGATVSLDRRAPVGLQI